MAIFYRSFGWKLFLCFLQQPKKKKKKSIGARTVNEIKQFFRTLFALSNQNDTVNMTENFIDNNESVAV